MITKVTEANQALYADLFKSINKALKEELNVTYDDIGTIEEYFLHLEDIATLVGRNKAKYTYFLRLPTDEYLFTINADTRIINVPAHFRSHGIAVAGDHLAETIWFKIDKYYDIQDLSSLDVRIYWELPGGGKDNKGQSNPQFKDVNSEAGYILLGWTIPEILTKKAGNLTFSLEFYETLVDLVEGSEPYSFNTLPQTVKIQANNLINGDDYITDNTGMDTVLNRLKNSNFDTIFVAPPTFSTYMPEELDANDMIVDSVGPTLFASAYETLAVDPTIRYSWTRGTTNLGTGEIAFKQIDAGSSLIAKQIYYTGASDEEYLGYGSDEEVINAHANGDPLYEKGSQLAITSIGNYQVQAIAQVSTTVPGEDEPKTSSSRPAYGKVWKFESPTPIDKASIGITISEKGIIHSDAENKPEITITFPTETNGQQAFANWSAKIYKMIGDAPAVTVDTLLSNSNNFEVTEEGKYYALVGKKLNDVEADSVYTDVIYAQKGATKANVVNNSGTTMTLKGTAIPELTYTYSEDAPIGQTYTYFVYYRDYGTGKWHLIDSKGQSSAPNSNNYIANYLGDYAIIIKSKYGQDEVYSITEEELSNNILFKVYSLG